MIDVSGSMGDPAGGGRSKLELAKEAAIDSLSLFAPDDDVGLWVFTTDMARRRGLPGADPDRAPRSEPRPSSSSEIRGSGRRRTARRCTRRCTTRSTRCARSWTPTGSTASSCSPTAGTRIRGNQDLDGLLRYLDSELNVRVFPIAYGEDADLQTLTRIAQASRAAVYDASDPTTISKVFVSVISNF